MMNDLNNFVNELKDQEFICNESEFAQGSILTHQTNKDLYKLNIDLSKEERITIINLICVQHHAFLDHAVYEPYKTTNTDQLLTKLEIPLKNGETNTIFGENFSFLKRYKNISSNVSVNMEFIELGELYLKEKVYDSDDIKNGYTKSFFISLFPTYKNRRHISYDLQLIPNEHKTNVIHFYLLQVAENKSGVYECFSTLNHVSSLVFLKDGKKNLLNANIKFDILDLEIKHMENLYKAIVANINNFQVTINSNMLYFDVKDGNATTFSIKHIVNKDNYFSLISKYDDKLYYFDYHSNTILNLYQASCFLDLLHGKNAQNYKAVELNRLQYAHDVKFLESISNVSINDVNVHAFNAFYNLLNSMRLSNDKPLNKADLNSEIIKDYRNNIFNTFFTKVDKDQFCQLKKILEEFPNNYRKYIQISFLDKQYGISRKIKYENSISDVQSGKNDISPILGIISNPKLVGDSIIFMRTLCDDYADNKGYANTAFRDVFVFYYIPLNAQVNNDLLVKFSEVTYPGIVHITDCKEISDMSKKEKDPEIFTSIKLNTLHTLYQPYFIPMVLYNIYIFFEKGNIYKNSTINILDNQIMNMKTKDNTSISKNSLQTFKNASNYTCNEIDTNIIYKLYDAIITSSSSTSNIKVERK